MHSARWTRRPRSPGFAHTHVTFDDGLVLDCGASLPRLTVAYRTYGTLNAARSNAVLICHALTGDQYVAEPHPMTGKPGWWELVVGPGPAGRYRPVLRHLRQCAGRLHGHRPGRGRATRLPTNRRISRGAPIFRRSPSATWCGHRSG